MDDTICAISTSTGIGAISIIRVSGENSIKLVNQIFQGADLTLCNTHTINYGFIKYNNEIIDEVLISIMKSPKTYTKENIVEINCHGGIATTNKILEILLEIGCRLAEPGEFTKRAFLNGRIDLVEAESVGDLLKAETDKYRELSIKGISGSISQVIKQIRKKLLSISANIEVNIDYPEYEDIKVIENKVLKPDILNILSDLEKLLKDSENTKLIKNGIDVAIVGKPNVGKSSILNNLIQEDKAIVTNIAGTTRDIVEGKIILEGIVLNLIDTAGIRETNDIVEKIGVNKSKEIIKKSDLVIFVLNNNDLITDKEKQLINDIESENQNIIIFINKDDLEKKINIDEINTKHIVYGNTLSITGLDSLKEKIKELFNLETINSKNISYLSNARQISLVKKAIQALRNCLIQLENNIEIDLLAIDIKECCDLLGEIIGVNYKEELLDEIFANFCLGK